MRKVGKKSALFFTVVTFTNSCMMFTPDQNEFTEILLTLLNDMISCVKNITRVHEKMKIYFRLKTNDNTFCDINKMITSSVRF